MSQQGGNRASNSCSVSGKKQRGAVPRVGEQQPAGCQGSHSALQRAEGRDGNGPSSLPRKRTEPARPWDGAGHGGKRKASTEGDASGLPAKRSLAESLGRNTEHNMAPKRGPGAGGRAFPAVDPHSVSTTLAGRKRKGLEQEEQLAEPFCANKRVRSECSGENAMRTRRSGGSVPAPAAQPGPAAARSSKRRARRQRQKERRVEMMKAALRAAAARTESSTMDDLVEMMQKLQLKD